MKHTLALVCLSLLTLPAAGLAAQPDSRFYEMRTYYAAEGKADAMHARFRNHTLKLFEKHGMVNIGYWTSLDDPNKLVYILAYPSREAREKSWKAFTADPDWQAAAKASEVNGKLVTKAESWFLKATEYSPEIKPSVNAPRVFELRTYTAAPGRLDALNARFRDHTLALFKKHGIANFGYWNPVDQDKGADNTLVYLLAHKSKESAAESFKTFGADPDWVAARKTSEEKAGGPLTVKGGVKSEFLTPTDYSPTR